jgi:hypothetical protein
MQIKRECRKRIREVMQQKLSTWIQKRKYYFMKMMSYGEILN